MQLDLTTFILEVLNFLVLVWLLKRFLYKPVLSVLDARQQRIQGEMRKAAVLQEDAARLKQQYEARLADWNTEREIAKQSLEQELARERDTGMKAIQQSLADEEAKNRVRAASAIATREAELVRNATSGAYRNAAAMLRRMASPAMTLAILNILLDDLASLSEKRQEELHKAAHPENVTTMEVVAAHALEESAQRKLGDAVAKVCGKPLQATFKTDTSLIAGLRISLGESVLHANLADELGYFRSQDKNV